MKRKITMIMVLFMTMFAQLSFATETWTTGETLAAGSYYLYNVGAKKYLSSGANWNTHATVDNYGIPVTLANISDGIYTIATASTSGGYLSGLYCDGASTNWTITSTGGTDNSYYISSDGTSSTYLGYDGTNAALISTATGDNANWYLISKDSRTSAFKTAMASATESSPVAITGMISYRDFSRNMPATAAIWGTAVTLGGYYPNAASSNFCGEEYNKTFDVYQTLTGLPNGIYKFTCQGFYRAGSTTAAATAYTAGTASNSLLYINDETSAIESICKDAVSTKLGQGTESSVTLNSSTMYIPNNMLAAAYYFLQGKYSDNAVTATVTDGTVKFGVKKTTTINTDWTIFDSFRLYYYGVDLTAYKTALAAKIALDAVTASTFYDATATYTQTQLESMLSQATTAVTNANASVTKYAALKTAIDDVTTKGATFTGSTDGKTAFDAAVAAANTAYTSETYSDDEATAEITTLNNALYTYVKTQTADGSDYTLLIPNNSFETGDLTSWTANKGTDTGARTVGTSGTTYYISNTDGTYLFNTWGGLSTYNVRQTITDLPEGFYTITAVAGTSGSVNVYGGSSTVTVTSTDATVGNTVTTPVEYVAANGSLEIGATSSNWFKVDNFKMTYHTVTSDNITSVYNARLATATAAKNNTDYTNVTGDELTALNAAIAQTAPTTTSELATACNALTTATAAFTSAKAAYDAWLTCKDSVTSTSTIFTTTNYPYASAAKYTAMTTAAAATPTTAALALSDAAALRTAYRQFVESNNKAEGISTAVNYTSSITNPTAAAVTGWTNSGNTSITKVLSSEPYTDGDGSTTHSYFDGGNWSGTSWTVDFNQTLSALPAGKYLLSVMGRANTSLTSFNLYAGSTTAAIPYLGNTGCTFLNGWNSAWLVFTQDADNSAVKIGVSAATSSQYQRSEEHT